MDTIIAFIGASVEARQFGLNSSTFWSLGAGLVTFIQAYGSWMLARRIYVNKSAEGVSVLMLAYWHASIWGFAYYGWHSHSITMVFNSLVLAPLYSAAIVGMVAFGRSKIRTLVVMLVPALVLPPLLVFAVDKSLVLMVILLGGMVFFLDQPRKLYREKRTGSFDPKFTVALMVASTFWFFFAVTAIHDVTLMIINPLSFAISLVTLHAYARARKHELRISPI